MFPTTALEWLIFGVIVLLTIGSVYAGLVWDGVQHDSTDHPDVS